MPKSLQQLLFLAQLEEYDQTRLETWLIIHPDAEIEETKKHLVWTPKARIIFYLGNFFCFLRLYPKNALFLGLNIISLPENLIKKIVVLLAAIKLSLFPKLLIIAITGSFGKTSVKEILYQVLSSKYQVLKTPENINTPLGIARVILKDLTSEHQVFIVEMGAYQKGDIKKLSHMVKPRIGILTAIGKQHLERFGSVENIITAKSELFEDLPANGLAILNGDNTYCLNIAKKLRVKTILYSINNKISKPTTNNQTLTTITAVNIAVSKFGSSFQIKNDRGMLTLKTALLGTHNVLNILPAVAIAKELGISSEKISDAVSALSPLPHRLQPILAANGTLIIDDSYNANPSSVKAALAVLRELNSPRKIVITPGLVELGSEQEKENELFGEQIAAVADYLIVVGNTNTKSLQKGFNSIAYSSSEARSSRRVRLDSNNNLFTCQNLEEATQKLQQIVIPKSIILFENDLPDQYI